MIVPSVTVNDSAVSDSLSSVAATVKVCVVEPAATVTVPDVAPKSELAAASVLSGPPVCDELAASSRSDSGSWAPLLPPFRWAAPSFQVTRSLSVSHTWAARSRNSSISFLAASWIAMLLA